MINLIKRYRPERHYMRGRGPKWIERHGRIDQADPVKDNRRSNKRARMGFFSKLAQSWRRGEPHLGVIENLRSRANR